MLNDNRFVLQEEYVSFLGIIGVGFCFRVKEEEVANFCASLRRTHVEHLDLELSLQEKNATFNLTH